MLCQAQDINCRPFLSVWRDCFLSGNLHLCVTEGAGQGLSYFSLFVLFLGAYFLWGLAGLLLSLE